MDPNTTLRELRDAIVQLGRLNTPDAPDAVYHSTNAVIERWSALDTWISNGGFFPSAWTEAQRRALENTRPTRLDLPPSPEDEARTELERRALNRTRTRCWQTTLAGTESPVPCPPPGDTVDEVSDLLDGDPWRP